MAVAVCARALLARGARVNSRSQRGCSALGMAAEAGLAEVVLLLLKAGAEVDAATEDGMTPLMLASQNGHGDAARELCAAEPHAATAPLSGIW